MNHMADRMEEATATANGYPGAELTGEAASASRRRATRSIISTDAHGVSFRSVRWWRSSPPWREAT